MVNTYNVAQRFRTGRLFDTMYMEYLGSASGKTVERHCLTYLPRRFKHRGSALSLEFNLADPTPWRISFKFEQVPGTGGIVVPSVLGGFDNGVPYSPPFITEEETKKLAIGIREVEAAIMENPEFAGHTEFVLDVVRQFDHNLERYRNRI